MNHVTCTNTRINVWNSLHYGYWSWKE